MPFFKNGRARQLFAGLTGGLCLVISGNWTGWLSPFLHKIQKGEVPFKLTTDEISWVVALPELVNIASPLIGGYTMDWLGRKPTFFIIAVVYELSWLFTIFANGVYFLYIARFLTGIGNGLTYTVVPMFLAEIAETKIRGAIGGLFTVLLFGGTLFELIISYFVPFKTMEIISAVVPIIFFICLLFIPESPHYLFMKNNYLAASKAYNWLRNSSNEKNLEKESNKKELEDINGRVRKEMESRGRWLDLISTKGARRATITVMTISVLQRFTGINVMLTYMVTTLPSDGVGIGPDECMMIFALLLTVVSFINMFIVDRLGRKPALLLSGMVLSIIQCVTAFFYYSKNLPNYNITHIHWIPYVCMLIFAVFYQAGIGIVSHILLGEMFPANIKSKAAAAATIFFSISTFAIQKTFPIISETYGVETVFIIFSICNAFCAIFTYFYVIETKGKTFGEIQDILNG